MGRPFVDQATTERTRRFYAWERRGRGWDVFESTVELEPVFRWPQIHERAGTAVDDTRRAPWLARLLSQAKATEETDTYEEVPEAYVYERSEPLREFVTALPPSLSVPPEHSAALLSSLATLTRPLAFEVVAENGNVRLRLACTGRDEALLTSTLRSIAPEAQIAPTRPLSSLWQDAPGAVSVVIEFGLGREFMLPLGGQGIRGLDTLAPLITGLASLPRGLAILQTLFVPVEAPWAEATAEAVTTPGGKPFFADAPHVTKGASEKIASPLFAVVLRLAVKAVSTEAAYRVVRAVAGGLSRLGSPSGNELIPLGSNDTDTLRSDLLRRTSHRTGMLLSARELANLVRLPSTSATTALVSPSVLGKAAPEHTRQQTGESVRLGTNSGSGKRSPVYLSEDERLRHTHVLGASGTGKSTLLIRLILQDIEAGRGVAVFDPHGDLVDDVLARIPDERLADTILFDPTDEAAVVGWNVLSASNEVERQLLASDLVAVFRRLATSWGDQMTTVLANAILAFLDHPEGGTLLDLRRFLVEPAFRDRVVAGLRDPHLQSFWRTEFPLLVGRRPQAPILTRLDTLLRHRLVRGVVTAREGALDFRQVIDERRVFLARLAQGAIGRENAALLGSLLAARFHHTALARQDTATSERSGFFLYLDEFHELATPSMATLFSGIRKYGVGLTVAHHSLHQLRSAVPDVERAVLDNAHTRIVFRVGEEDARRLASGFAGFTPDDLTSLAIGQAVARIGGSNDAFDLATEVLPALDEADASAQRARVRETSRTRWGRARPAPPQRARPAPTETTTFHETRVPIPPAAPPAPLVETPPSPPSHPTPEEVDALLDATPPEPEPSPPQRTEGRGGPEHLYLQSLIREWAQARGFKTDLEYELESGGRVDLVLSKESKRVAVEISVTTGYEHELGNVRKCLDAGFERVFVVSMKRDFLKRIEILLTESHDKKELSRVSVVTPEDLMAWLADEPVSEGKVAGYTVKTQLSGDTLTEVDARRARLASVLGKSLKRLRKDG